MRWSFAVVALLAVPLKAEDAIAPDWASSAGRPAFHAVQAVADGVYDFASGSLFKPLLPESLASRLDSAPDADSYESFSAHLAAGEERAARRDQETRPAPDADPEAIAAWSRTALATHRAAAMDAFAATMGERYGLPGFGRSANDFVRDPDNWSPAALGSAALFGGAYAFVAGVRADVPAGPVAFALDAAPGDRLIAPSCHHELARVAVGPRGSPFSVYAEWDAHEPERVGARWSQRF
jgi:hypothetical protein